MMTDDAGPYNSYGNGSAMRVGPVGWAYESLEQTLTEAKKSAECTHSHPEGIRGAQAVAAAVFLARQGESKEYIKSYIEKQFEYQLNKSVKQLRHHYKFTTEIWKTVPEAICVFLESEDFEDAIRKAIFIGGDSDTIGAIVGSISEAYYKQIPETLIRKSFDYLTPDLKQVVEIFSHGYGLIKPGIPADPGRTISGGVPSPAI